MEQDFQTSFIPKKPVIESTVATPGRVSFLTILSLFIFFTIILASGGLFFYKTLLAKNVDKMTNDLNLAKNRFEPSTIVRLQVLDKRLRAATEVLSKHITISPIFQALQDSTMPTVRYTNFSYSLEEKPEMRVKVDMKGLAVGYRSIALQADLLAASKYFIDPIFSNLSLDQSGNVLFDLTFYVDPVFIDYHQMLESQEKSETSTPAENIDAPMEENAEETVEETTQAPAPDTAPVAPANPTSSTINTNPNPTTQTQ